MASGRPLMALGEMGFGGLEQLAHMGSSRRELGSLQSGPVLTVGVPFVTIGQSGRKEGTSAREAHEASLSRWAEDSIHRDSCQSGKTHEHH